MQGLGSLPKAGSMTASSANLIGGQAIGSLPKGLTFEEKKSILQATPMSPALSLLNNLDPVRAPPCVCLEIGVFATIAAPFTPCGYVCTCAVPQ